MRRRAALYFVLGLATAMLIVALATGLQTGGSPYPNDWLRAQRRLPLLQMLDLAAVFLFVVIGLYGLTVSRLQLQLQHQAEDFGDQMQTLLHRNEELAKVNDEYAEQIAALETDLETSPTLVLGDRSQRVVAALHRQVEAQAQQLEAVHLALAQQHTDLQELRGQMHTLQQSAVPRLAEEAEAPRLSESPALFSPPEEREPAAEEANPNFADWTANDSSTLIGGVLEFDVSGFAPLESPHMPDLQAVFAAEARTYPVDDSFLAVAAGHLSSMPDPAPTPPSEPPRVEIRVGPEPDAVPPPSDLPPTRTQGALALDLAETALSSLQTQTQEALSSLRAQVEATIPQEAAPAAASGGEPERTPPKRRPWHLRF